jgi:hypothetical protein
MGLDSINFAKVFVIFYCCCCFFLTTHMRDKSAYFDFQSHACVWNLHALRHTIPTVRRVKSTRKFLHCSIHLNSRAKMILEILKISEKIYNFFKFWISFKTHDLNSCNFMKILKFWKFLYIFQVLKIPKNSHFLYS